MANNKERLDLFLVEKGYFTTREKARKNILAGLVYVNDKKIDRPGENINMDSSIEVKGESIPFVSRGGLKLDKAIREFSIEVEGKTAIDVGASTGGFTDCLLKYGAVKVFSIDVGYNQFAKELRDDPRVTVMEHTNIRSVTLADIGLLCDICVIDVSFISLKLVLPVVKNLIKDGGEIVCLIKPQFEAGKERVGKKGVVKDPEVHRDVIKSIIVFSTSIGLSTISLSYSPIKGSEGNIEYLLYLKNMGGAGIINQIDVLIDHIVDKSHES